MSQIAAQITKVNPWENPITKVDIPSFVTPKYRSLVPSIGFIYILQYGTLDETAFVGLAGHCLDQLASSDISGWPHISAKLPD